MVVAKDHRCCVVRQCELHDLARMDGAGVDGPLEQLFEKDQSVQCVQEDDREHFVFIARKLQSQKIGHVVWTGERNALLEKARFKYVECFANGPVFLMAQK